MARPKRRWASFYVLIAVLAVMAFPLIVFPHPRTNDAIALADLELPLLLIEVVLAIVAYVVFKGERGALIGAGLGVYLFASAIALVVGLFAFGNLSNDRFAPLLFIPPVLAVVGLAGAVVAITAGHLYRAALWRGAGYGVALALGFGAWTLVRGARAWLEAPYGFDLLLLLGILGVGVVVLGTSPNIPKSIVRG